MKVRKRMGARGRVMVKAMVITEVWKRGGRQRVRGIRDNLLTTCAIKMVEDVLL